MNNIRSFLEKNFVMAKSRIKEGAWGSWYYQLPSDPFFMMMDFYYFSLYLGVDFKDRKWDTLGMNQDLRIAIPEAIQTIAKDLGLHMQKALKFAICAELRHVRPQYFGGNHHSGHDPEYDGRRDNDNYKSEYDPEYSVESYSPKEIKLAESLEEHSSSFRFAYKKFKSSRLLRDPLFVGSYDSRKAAYYNSVLWMKKFKMTEIDFAKFAMKLFGDLPLWAGGYGGDMWAGIAEGLLRLLQASNIMDTYIAIDHAYDLQHNNDTVFQKLASYNKHGYDWIKKALDWKRYVTDPRAFYQFVSPDVRPIVAYMSKIKDNAHMDTYTPTVSDKQFKKNWDSVTAKW